MLWIYQKTKLTAQSTKLFCIILLLFFFNQSFSAQDKPLLAPTISVENPIEVNTSTFTLSWDALDETNSYKLELCSDAACDFKIKELLKTGSPNTTLSDIKNGQYFWRVCGVDQDNKLGNYSTPQPLLLEIKEVSIPLEADKENTPNTVSQLDIQSRFSNLPWYIYTIILAYIIFITRTLIWHFNK